MLLRRRLTGFTPDMRLHKLADDVYVFRGFFSNSAVLVMQGGVVVVDSQTTPEGGQRLHALIKTVTDKPVVYVVNTHYHGDHVGGNMAFPDAQVVAPALTARFIQERDQERVEYCHTFGLTLLGVPEVRGPDITFEGRHTLQVGEDSLELMQVGRCETPDACVAWWGARRVVCPGDGVATDQYPWLGVPFLDEGLQDDGDWLRYLSAVTGLRAVVLIPGHGAPLLGEHVIERRLQLLSQLLTDLLETTRQQLQGGVPFEQLVEHVDQALSHYREDPALVERVVSQRFAIYRAYNSVNPERRGKGWWHDLRPSVLGQQPAAPEGADAMESGHVIAQVRRLLGRSEVLSARALLDAWLMSHPDDSEVWALKAEVELRGALITRPIVDATEYIRACSASAERALAIERTQPVALLCRGAVDVWSCLVTSQPVDQPIANLQRALDSGKLSRRLTLIGRFFVAKAHQAVGRDAECERAFRELLPWPLRPMLPLLINQLRTLP